MKYEYNKKKFVKKVTFTYLPEKSILYTSIENLIILFDKHDTIKIITTIQRST